MELIIEPIWQVPGDRLLMAIDHTRLQFFSPFGNNPILILLTIVIGFDVKYQIFESLMEIHPLKGKEMETNHSSSCSKPKQMKMNFLLFTNILVAKKQRLRIYFNMDTYLLDPSQENIVSYMNNKCIN